MSGGVRTLRLLIALAVVLGATAAAPPRWLERDDATVAVAPSELRALQAARPPALSARNAALLDVSSGALLYAKAADERVAPASLTKMMTALVALEQGQLAQRITASPNVYVEPVVIGIDPGESMSLEDLLYGLMLTSGNDAGVAVAEGLAGSVPRFATEMNRKAAQLELRNTRFLNPHGLDEPGHYASAEDLARLAAAMMRHPMAARITGTRVHTVPGPPLYQFRNSNPLLGTVEGVDGGKTGFTDLAGRCLAVSATRNGRQVIAVVLGSQNIATDGQALLEFAYSTFTWTDVAPPDWRLLAYEREGALQQARAPRAVVALPPWERGRLRLQVVLDQVLAEGALGRLLVDSPLRRVGEFRVLPAEGGR